MQDNGETLYAANETVVVVNDDTTQRGILCGLLRKGGMFPVPFESAEAALNAMSNHQPPGLIVTDLYMPGIDGWRFCRLLRSPEYAAFNPTPIVVVSATFAGEEATLITADLGANAFLPMPVDGARFIELVRGLLAGRSPQQMLGVLIVEDSKTLCRLLTRTFKSHGYRVETALTGYEATAKFHQDGYEIVVLDYHLPDISGNDLLVDFREQRPDSIFVMMTTDPRPELALDWMKKGASAYVRKPFEPEYLLSLCQRARRERMLLRVEDLLEARARQLREQEERYRLVVENQTEFICKWLPDMTLTFANETYCRFLGRERKDVIGKKWIELIPERSRAEEESRIASTVQAGELAEAEHDICTASGEIRWVQWINRPVSDEQGQPREFLSVGRDITERKRMEAERLQLERRLLYAQKLESLGMMAGGIAHDFNNLLMVVLGNLELALMRLSPGSSANRNIEQAVQASKQAADLGHQMLTYSGAHLLVDQELSLGEIVAENLHLVRAAIAKTISLDLQVEEDLPPIMGDAGHLQQILVNLVTNAAEAIGGQPGTVVVSTGVQICDQTYLNQSCLQEKPAPGKFVFLDVTDNGCGFDEETRHRLFDPFYTTKFMGRGLGMSAVLGIVRGHRGAILVESEPGIGTTVRVLFPVMDTEPMGDGWTSVVQREDADVAGRQSMSGTILVVDDEKMVCDLCAEMVEHFGFRVLTAADGEESLMIFQKYADEIVCVILDLAMPRMDGVAAFESMRHIKPDVKVILSSGYNEQEAIERFAGKGLAGFIKKPYQMDALNDALGRAIGRAHWASK
jgi:PAS domain S-box-containing protein